VEEGRGWRYITTPSNSTVGRRGYFYTPMHLYKGRRKKKQYLSSHPVVGMKRHSCNNAEIFQPCLQRYVKHPQTYQGVSAYLPVTQPATIPKPLQFQALSVLLYQVSGIYIIYIKK
jgi:hypothetical protein